MQFTVGGGGFI